MLSTVFDCFIRLLLSSGPANNYPLKIICLAELGERIISFCLSGSLVHQKYLHLLHFHRLLYPAGGQNIYHLNTPLTRDEVGLTIRGESSHAETGFVIFLDVLGMKRIWERLLPRQVIKRWDEAIHAFMDSIEEHHSQLGVIPYLRALSDTIIITIPTQRTDSNIDQLFDLLPFVNSIKAKMLFRGTISYGSYYLYQIDNRSCS